MLQLNNAPHRIDLIAGPWEKASSLPIHFLFLCVDDLQAWISSSKIQSPVFLVPLVKCSIPSTSSNRYSNPSSPVAPRQHIALIRLEAFTGEFPIQGPDQFQDFGAVANCPANSMKSGPCHRQVTGEDMPGNAWWHVLLDLLMLIHTTMIMRWVIKHDFLFFRAFASAEPTQNTNAYKRLIHSNPR